MSVDAARKAQGYICLDYASARRVLRCLELLRGGPGISDDVLNALTLRVARDMPDTDLPESLRIVEGEL